MERTWCNDLRKSHAGQEVNIRGWVFRRRDHGGVIFVDARDRTGVVQLVFSQDIHPGAHELAEQLRGEFVISATGKVRPRAAQDINPRLETGEIEIEILDLKILNVSRTIPFSLEESETPNEEVRLKYRYLDMRRNQMKHNMVTRHRLYQSIRRYVDNQGFLEIETPILNKSTPEGARDFLVPSRLSAGEFYALPQSPQLFKQILMVAGMERYYQIARCFRDEDLRADRQLEFTQLDMELSFIDEEDIYRIMEGLWFHVMKETFDLDLTIPFPRITYQEAMERFGKDAPDMRFGMELKDVAAIAANCDFKVFRENASKPGFRVKAICVPGGASLSRTDIDNLTAFVARYGAKGLAWMKHTESGLESTIAKFFKPDELQSLAHLLGSKPGDILFFVADTEKIVHDSLANLRLHLGRTLKMIPEDEKYFIWVTDFPAFEFDAAEGRYYSMHHPFTNINPDDLAMLDNPDPRVVVKARARAYDLVLNGTEIGGGSIRIHDNELQQKVFRLLGITLEEAKIKFSFLLEALQFGAPPHGGIAFGLDRIMALLLKQESIRDVIPFPKTQKGQCLMSNAPSPVDPGQLQELFIRVVGKKTEVTL